MKIQHLRLFTTNLEAQIDFYSDVLGLEVDRISDQEAQVKMGTSVLSFIKAPEATPYHYAINIPSNKEHEALAWLKERVTVLKDEEHEIQDFDFWNAMAVYFYDQDLNIVELIARKTLDNTSDKPFSQGQFLEISEIGLPTDDIKTVFDYLHETTGIPQYDGNFERFCAIGDEHGLFICINYLEKDFWFPTNDKVILSPFTMAMEVAQKRFELVYSEGTVEVSP